MTIEKGAPWGSPGLVPADVSYADNDRELAVSHGTTIVRGGNLHEALGCPRQKLPGEECMLLPVDAIQVEIQRSDLRVVRLTGASEVVVGSWFSRRGFIVVTNTGHLGALHIAPRAHPNDGFLDTLEIDGAMALRERLLARFKARTGTHVPHPLLRTGRTVSITLSRRGREGLRVDGIDQGDWRTVTVEVSADRWLVAV